MERFNLLRELTYDDMNFDVKDAEQKTVGKNSTGDGLHANRPLVFLLYSPFIFLTF